MKITVNGDTLELTSPCSVSALLNQLDMGTGRVAVEIRQ